jgi:hypothetical protein
MEVSTVAEKLIKNLCSVITRTRQSWNGPPTKPNRKIQKLTNPKLSNPPLTSLENLNTLNLDLVDSLL